MSGGVYDYAYCQVNRLVEQLKIDSNPKREAFKDLLGLIADAMYHIEMVDKGDSEEGSENESIEKVLLFLDRRKPVIEKAQSHALDMINEILDSMSKGK